MEKIQFEEGDHASSKICRRGPSRQDRGRSPTVARVGQVLVKIGGAGVCHSDLHVMDENLGFKPPFILGHENAGWIEELGEGVTSFEKGDAVAVYGPWGCGRCYSCQLSMENYCENWASLGTFGGGLGSDGGMADYMLVSSARLLVPLGDLSPAKAASKLRFLTHPFLLKE